MGQIKINFDSLPEADKVEPTLWEKANTPLVDLRSNPTMRAATEEFEKTHPYLGKTLNFATDTVSGMSSPISLMLMGVTGGAGALEGLGITKPASIVHKAMKVGAAGMTGHGTYRAVTAEKGPDKLAGLLEAGMGGLGLLPGGPKGPASFADEFKGEAGAKKAYAYLKKTTKPVLPEDPEYPRWKAAQQTLDEYTLQNRRSATAKKISDSEDGRPEVPSNDKAVDAGTPMTLDQVKAWYQDQIDKGLIKEMPTNLKADSFKGLKISSRGLSDVEAESAHAAGNKMLVGEVKSANAMEQAKGGLSQIQREELVTKKPLLDLIEKGQKHPLTTDEWKKLNDEVTQYPKGVVSKQLDNVRRMKTLEEQKHGQASAADTKAAAADTKLQLDTEAEATKARNQEIKDINEGFKANADATKGLAWAEKIKAKLTERDAAQQAKNLGTATKKLDREFGQAVRNKGVREDAIAQQDKLNQLKEKLTEVQDPSSVTEYISGKGENGGTERAAIRRVAPEPPPEGEGGTAPAGGGEGGQTPSPTEPNPIPEFDTKPVYWTKNEALKVARKAGLDRSKWTIQGSDDDGWTIGRKWSSLSPEEQTARLSKTSLAAESEDVPASTEEKGSRPFESLTSEEMAAIEPHIIDAFDHGYKGEVEDLADELAGRLGAIKEGRANLADTGASADELLAAIRKAGGFKLGDVTDSDMSWLKDNFQKPGQYKNGSMPRSAQGLFRKKGGRTPDRMLEYLHQDGKFQHIKSIEDLVKVFKDAARSGGQVSPTDELARGLAPNWWDRSGSIPDVGVGANTDTHATPPAAPPPPVPPTPPADIPPVVPPPPAEPPASVVPPTPPVPPSGAGESIAPPEPIGTPPTPATNISSKMNRFNENNSDELEQLLRDAHGDEADNVMDSLNPAGRGSAPVAPFVGPTGEQEPVLPGIQPTQNVASPLAEAPFSLSSEVAHPAGPPSGNVLQFPPAEPPPVEPSAPPVEPPASVPFMITKKMAKDLRGLGYTPADINKMTPAQAHESLKAGPKAQTPPAEAPPPTAPMAGLVQPAAPPADQAMLDQLVQAGDDYGKFKSDKAAGLPVDEAARSAAGKRAQQLTTEAAAANPNSDQLVNLPQQTRDALLKRMVDSFKKSRFINDQGGAARMDFILPEQAEQLPDVLQKAGTTINNFRRSSLLSAYSMGKKVIGDAGALATGAMYHPTRIPDMARSLFNPETMEDFHAGYNAPTEGFNDRSGYGDEFFYSKKNPLGTAGRTMSGMTQATKGVLQRSGFTEEEAKALTLTKNPNRWFGKAIYGAFNKPGMNHLNPFSRIATNWLESGYEHSPLGLTDYTNWKNMSPAERIMVAKKAALGTGAGIAAYALTPEDYLKEHPIAAHMMTAGPMGPTMLLGMALRNTTGSAPTELVKEIPGMRLAEDLKDAKNFPAHYYSSYTNSTRPLAELMDHGRERDTSIDPDASTIERLLNFKPAMANIPILRETLPLKPEEGYNGLNGNQFGEPIVFNPLPIR